MTDWTDWEVKETPTSQVSGHNETAYSIVIKGPWPIHLPAASYMLSEEDWMRARWVARTLNEGKREAREIMKELGL